MSDDLEFKFKLGDLVRVVNQGPQERVYRVCGRLLAVGCPWYEVETLGGEYYREVIESNLEPAEPDADGR